MLSKIHVSYIPGSMGDFVTAILMASYYNQMPKIEITKQGRCIIKDERFSKVFKTNPTPRTELPNLNRKKFLKKTNNDCMFSNCHYLRHIPLLESCWFKTQWLEDLPILIYFNQDEAEEIAGLFSNKNPNKIIIDSSVIHTQQTRLVKLIEEYDLFYIQYKDIKQNLQKVIKQISKYKNIQLEYNDNVQLLEEKYARKNTHLFHIR